MATSLSDSAASQLSHAASVAFTDALGIGFVVAACAAVVAVIAVRRWLPADDRVQAPDTAAALATAA